MTGVYAILNTVTGWRYIGSAIDIERRWHWHRSRLKHGSHHNIPLQRAWVKYGADAFRFMVCAVVDASRLAAQEAMQIASEPCRYNTCAVVGRPPSARGRILSAETRARMSAAHLGKRPTPATRAKMSAAWRDRTTPESVAKIAAAKRGRKLTPVHRAKVVAALNRYYGRTDHIDRVTGVLY